MSDYSFPTTNRYSTVQIPGTTREICTDTKTNKTSKETKDLEEQIKEKIKTLEESKDFAPEEIGSIISKLNTYTHEDKYVIASAAEIILLKTTENQFKGIKKSVISLLSKLISDTDNLKGDNDQKFCNASKSIYNLFNDQVSDNIRTELLRSENLDSFYNEIKKASPNDEIKSFRYGGLLHQIQLQANLCQEKSTTEHSIFLPEKFKTETFPEPSQVKAEERKIKKSQDTPFQAGMEIEITQDLKFSAKTNAVAKFYLDDLKKLEIPLDCKDLSELTLDQKKGLFEKIKELGPKQLKQVGLNHYNSYNPDMSSEKILMPDNTKLKYLDETASQQNVARKDINFETAIQNIQDTLEKVNKEYDNKSQAEKEKIKIKYIQEKRTLEHKLKTMQDLSKWSKEDLENLPSKVDNLQKTINAFKPLLLYDLESLKLDLIKDLGRLPEEPQADAEQQAFYENFVNNISFLADIYANNEDNIENINLSFTNEHKNLISQIKEFSDDDLFKFGIFSINNDGHIEGIPIVSDEIKTQNEILQLYEEYSNTNIPEEEKNQKLEQLKSYDKKLLNSIGLKIENQECIVSEADKLNQAHTTKELSELVNKLNDVEKNIDLSQFPEKFRDKMTNLLKLFPEFMTTIEKKQNGEHKYTLDQHILRVVANVLQSFEELPKNTLDDNEKKLLLTAALLHDISKKEGISDKEHPKTGAFYADTVLTKLNLSQEDRAIIYKLIDKHEWGDEYNLINDSNTILKNTEIAFDLKEDKLEIMSYILTQADIKGIGKDEKGTEKLLGSAQQKYENLEKKIKNIREHLNYLKEKFPISDIPDASTIEDKIQICINAIEETIKEKMREKKEEITEKSPEKQTHQDKRNLAFIENILNTFEKKLTAELTKREYLDQTNDYDDKLFDELPGIFQNNLLNKDSYEDVDIQECIETLSSEIATDEKDPLLNLASQLKGSFPKDKQAMMKAISTKICTKQDGVYFFDTTKLAESKPEEQETFLKMMGFDESIKSLDDLNLLVHGFNTEANLAWIDQIVNETRPDAVLSTSYLTPVNTITFENYNGIILSTDSTICQVNSTNASTGFKKNISNIGNVLKLEEKPSREDILQHQQDENTHQETYNEFLVANPRVSAIYIHKDPNVDVQQKNEFNGDLINYAKEHNLIVVYLPYTKIDTTNQNDDSTIESSKNKTFSRR